jgi:hypothetical protein
MCRRVLAQNFGREMINNTEKRVYKFVMNTAAILMILPLVGLFLRIGLSQVLPLHNDGEDVTERILSAPRAARWRIVASWDSKPLVKVFDVWSTAASKRKYPLELSSKDRDAPGAICSRQLLLEIDSMGGEATASIQ